MSKKEYVKDIPRLAKEFDAENNDFTIDNLTTGSGKIVNWVCEKGHKWLAPPYRRKGGANCPYCVGRLPIKGQNDLATCYPDIANEWHPTKNGSFVSSDFKPLSNKKAWWLCPKSHEYELQIFNRTRGIGCPYCAGHLPIKGENDLATCYPDVAKQWHPTKNGDSQPEDFKPKSNKKVWWLCPQRHAYDAVISARTSQGEGCPYCSGRKAIEGETDLETLRPDIAKEWHPTQNGDIKPNTVTVGSESKYWWLCPEGHEYEMSVYNRTRNGRPHGCPYCSGKKPIAGVNDFGTVCKEAYQFWDYDKNDTVPSDYLPNSGAKVGMKCEKGHSWNHTVRQFLRSPKCPYCNGTTLEKGINTLSTLYPEVAEKWDYEKNGSTDIDKVYVGSDMKYYWWKCESGHSWMRSVNGMIKAIKTKGKGCPYCSGSISKYSI